MTLKTIPLILILSLLASCAQLSSQSISEVNAPKKLAGLQAELTFLTWESDLPDGSFPKTGQATHIYVTDTEFKTDGSKVNLPNAQGSYESLHRYHASTYPAVLTVVHLAAPYPQYQQELGDGFVTDKLHRLTL